MSATRKRHTNQFKFTISLEAAKGLKTINEIASTNNLHPNQISTWKKQLMTEGPAIFGCSGIKKGQKQIEQESELYEQIGRLKMELEWLKKKAAKCV
jgi:putative transposase